MDTKLSTDYPPPHRDSAKLQIGKKIEGSTESPLGKVCLISLCVPKSEQPGEFSYGEKPDWMDRCLILLDLDAERAAKKSGYVPRNPNLCFCEYTLGVSGCCVLGTTLYLFGSERNALFSYDLSTCPTPPPVVTLTRDRLTNVRRPMNFPKICPVGCQAPGGKMLVLSVCIEFDVDNIGKFEMFDPKNKRWDELPDLLPLLHDAWKEKSKSHPSVYYGFPYASVYSYSFIKDGPILLVTTDLGNFTIDTVQRGSCWARFNGFEFPPPNRRFMLVPDDGLALFDWLAIQEDGEDPPRYLLYPNLNSRISTYGSRGRGITWLTHNPFCVARCHIPRETLQPHLTVDVCSFDSGVFQSKKDQTTDLVSEVPGVTVTDRFEFVLGPEDWDSPDRFHALGLFSMID